jgi:hypothetical protein
MPKLNDNYPIPQSQLLMKQFLREKEMKLQLSQNTQSLNITAGATQMASPSYRVNQGSTNLQAI